MSDGERVRYRTVLANREFAGMLVSQALSTSGDQLARIAVAVLVYGRTGSDLAASATYAVSYLTYLLAGPVLSAVSDRRPRLPVMITCDLLRVPLVLILCVHSLPLWAVFAALTALGLVAPAFDAARSATQPDILHGEAYLTGNAIMNIVVQLGQVVGFALGGALVAAVSPQGALAVDAATFIISAGILMAAVQWRPPALQAEEPSNILTDTREGLRFVRATPALRRYLTFALIGSAALITPEGLAVPTARALGGGATAAGVLTATIPAGFVISGLAVLRLPAARRRELLFPLALLALIPLIASPLVSSVSALSAVWLVAGLGAALNLIASSAYVQSCPSEFRSRAYGVAATLLFGVQGGTLLLSGWLADLLGPRSSVAIFGAAGLAAVLALPSLRSRARSVPQENSDNCRSTQG